MKLKNLRVLSMITLSLFIVGCGASARKPTRTQTITVKDSATKQTLEGVSITLNGQQIGVTDEKGRFRHRLEQDNYKAEIVIIAKKEGYKDINLVVKNKVGGGYVVGNIVWLITGLVPGIIAFSVDGASGKWYVYKNKVNINMNPA